MFKYICFPGFRRKALTLSYDDGVRQDKRLISIMKQYGLKGTFNLNSGMFADTYDKETCGKMTKKEALDLYLPAGMEIATHGSRHLSLTDVEMPLAVNDIVTDRKELERDFGCVIKGMAYANGAYNDEVVDMLSKIGIAYARTAVATESFELPTDWLRLHTTCHHNNPRLMELAKKFVEQTEHWYYWCQELQLFYLWGHSYEFDNDNNWNIIEEFAAYIGNREDIWYATNGEIFDYLQACKRLEFSMDGSIVKNPTSMDIYLNYLETKVVIPAGQSVKIYGDNIE